MTLLIFVLAALYGGWRASRIRHIVLLSIVIGIINFVISLERLPTYRAQMGLGDTPAETSVAIAMVFLITWVFFFMISLAVFALRGIRHRLRHWGDGRPPSAEQG
jgi:hypothetical protein